MAKPFNCEEFKYIYFQFPFWASPHYIPHSTPLHVTSQSQVLLTQNPGNSWSHYKIILYFLKKREKNVFEFEIRVINVTQ